MGLGAPELLIGLISLVGLVVWVWALVDALGRPDPQWEAAGHSKMVWIVLLVFLGFLAGVIYLLSARPQLERAGHEE